MSHFTVLVVSANDLSDAEALERELQPFHEFECTGMNDEFVQDIDITTERQADWRAPETMVKLADGALKSLWDSAFYRDATDEEAARIKAGEQIDYEHLSTFGSSGDTYRIKELPAGAVIVSVAHSDRMTFASYLGDDGVEIVDHGQAVDRDGRHKHGYALLGADGEIQHVIRRTNPNAKWDWWSLGGRWQGMLRVKNPALAVQSTRNGSMGRPEDIAHFDATTKGNLDLDAMKVNAVRERRATWDRILGKLREKLEEPDLTSAQADELRRAAFADRDRLLPLWKADETTGKGHFFGWIKDHLPARSAAVLAIVVDYHRGIGQTAKAPDIEAWIAAAPSLETYALLKDGQWFARGEMGWFGMSHGDVEPERWSEEMEQLLRAAPDAHWLAVVDCHI